MGNFRTAKKGEEARIKEVYSKRSTLANKERYSYFNKGNLYIIQEREKRILNILKKLKIPSIEKYKILEIGCGTGYWLREFVKWGASPENLQGVDLLPERIGKAKQVCPKAITFQLGSATSLSYPNESFDLILQSTVFTSILDAVTKREIASEMLRVLKPEGIILWYDFHMNNPKNPDVRGVKSQEIYALFPNCKIDLQGITLAPPLARRIAPYSWLLCYLLEKIPFLCTHFLGVIRKL